VNERDDRQDISDLLVRYATGIDRRDWPLFRTVFTDDCQLDYGEIGAITLDGDNATARTYIDGLIMAGDNNSGVNAIGFYDDDVVRTPAGWRIARRRYTQVRITTVGGG
jgi:3-phenylpropionate/cinnamic acid dioxygenase small subunit